MLEEIKVIAICGRITLFWHFWYSSLALEESPIYDQLNNWNESSVAFSVVRYVFYILDYYFVPFWLICPDVEIVPELSSFLYPLSYICNFERFSNIYIRYYASLSFPTSLFYLTCSFQCPVFRLSFLVLFLHCTSTQVPLSFKHSCFHLKI